jgi:hypothetical protein
VAAFPSKPETRSHRDFRNREADFGLAFRLNPDSFGVILAALNPMKPTEKLKDTIRGPQLTQKRIVAALAVAALADFLQIALVPGQWFLVQQMIDVIAAVLTFLALGFHILLLPTFIVELFPVVDMMPTWTACVIAVIALRKREQRREQPPEPIEIESEVIPPETPSSDGSQSGSRK